MVARKTQIQTSCTRTKLLRTSSETTFGDEVEVPLLRQWRCPSHVRVQIREHLRKHRQSPIFSEMCRGALEGRVAGLADAFARRGVNAGDRVAVLIPPGADLLAVVYAVWRIGASIVVIDAAHGARSLLRSLKGARVDHVVAVRRAAPVVRLLNVPGEVFWQHRLGALLDAEAETRRAPAAHLAHSDAAIVFTSGATGPAKAVAYSRAGITATRDTLLGHYEFTDDDVLVAAFAPWAVLGPLLGISSVFRRWMPRVRVH